MSATAAGKIKRSEPINKAKEGDELYRIYFHWNSLPARVWAKSEASAKSKASRYFGKLQVSSVRKVGA